jgi:hypothetical protein
LSPTNVIRIPVFEELRYEDTHPWLRSGLAMKAYRIEMDFSGNVAEALLLYSFFFLNRCAKKQESVTLGEILDGTTATGPQLLQAIQAHKENPKALENKSLKKLRRKTYRSKVQEEIERREKKNPVGRVWMDWGALSR